MGRGLPFFAGEFQIFHRPAEPEMKEGSASAPSLPTIVTLALHARIKLILFFVLNHFCVFRIFPAQFGTALNFSTHQIWLFPKREHDDHPLVVLTMLESVVACLF